MKYKWGRPPVRLWRKGLNGRLVNSKFILNLMCGIALLFIVVPASTQWSTNPANNLIIGYGLLPEMCSDSMGGAYVTYENNTVYPRKIELRRVDSYGYQPWNGSRLIAGELPESRYASITPDGHNGVLIAYLEREQYPPPYHGLYKERLRVQRVDSNGNLLWGNNGVRVSLAEHNQSSAQYASIVADNNGGCILACIDTNSELRIQRINNAGLRVWGDSGICLATSIQDKPLLTKYLESDFIIEYYSTTNGFNQQRVDSDGHSVWGNSLIIPIGARMMRTESDGSVYLFGGQFLGYRNGKGLFTLNLQKIDSLGTILWDSLGVFLDTVNTNNIIDVDITTISNLTVATWRKEENGIFNVYIQFLRASGRKVFEPEEIPISGSSSSKSSPKIVISDSSRMIISWYDSRGSFYAQKIDTSGDRLWNPNDIVISSRALDYTKTITDGNNGIIVCGFDQSDFSIRIQQLSTKGYLGEIVTSIKGHELNEIGAKYFLEQNYPNPFNPITMIRYQLSVTMDVKLAIYNVLGQEVNVLVNEKQSVGNYSTMVDASQYPSGVYFYKLSSGTFTDVKKMLLIR